MTPPRLRHTVFTLAAMALVATGCATATPSENTTTDVNGQGQLGIDSTTTPAGTSAPTETASTAPPETTPPPAEPTSTPTVGFTFIIPPALLWPIPADCVSYDPGNVTLRYISTGTDAPKWVIVDGFTYLLTLKTLLSGQQAIAVAKAFHKLCYIGRADEPQANWVTYWLEPDGIPDVPQADCLSHDPGALSVVAAGSLWRVQTPSEAIYVFQVQENAQKAVQVLKHYNWHCFAGRDYTGSNRKDYIVEWFASAE